MEYPKVEKELFNVNNENLQKLASLFPSAVKDGQLDIEALKEELGQFEEVGQEKYELNWAGKQNAKKEARKNVLGKTLRYIEGDGVNEDTTQNLYIEGDNLEVLKLLRKNYYGSIKMIYIDPPYNTDGDFIYNDSFSITQEELEQLQGERDEYGERLQKNSKDSAKYHTNWLNMMYPRLQLAKDLLTDDGVILINIDEHEISNLLKLMNDIFSEINDLGVIVWDKRNPKGDAKGIAYQHEYIVCFAKNKVLLTENNQIKRPKKNATKILNMANKLFLKLSPSYTLEMINKDFSNWINSQTDLSGGERAYCKIDEEGNVYRPVSMAWPNKKEAPKDYFIPLIHPITNKPCPVPERGWRNPPSTMKELLEKGEILFGKDETTQPNRKYLLKDNMYENLPSLVYYGGSDTDLLQQMGIPFDTPKAIDIVKEHVITFTNEKDLVLDFFSGSATTAHAVMQLNSEDNGNRKFILVQLPEATEEGSQAKKAGFDNICEIGKERIRRAGQKIKEEIEQNNVQLKLGEEQKQLPDIGFKVFRVGETTLNWEKLRLQGEDILHDYLAGTSEKDKLDFTPTFENDLNVVYEIMLRQEGLPLTSTIEKLTDIGTRTYLVADSYLISLEESVTPEMIEKLSVLNPLPIKFVFRDSAFDDDIAFKDETFRKLNALIDKNTSDEKKTYTVEFI